MCGRVDVDQMLDEMTPAQFMEWQAKDIIEPIGHRGTQEILALFASMVASMMGKTVGPEVFAYWKQKPKEEVASHKSTMMALAAIGAKRG